MMAMKGRFAEAYSTGNHPNIESDGSDISPRLDMVTAYDDSVKGIGNGFEVPVQVFSLSSLSSYEKKSLAVRLQSELEKIRSFEKKYALLRSNNVAVSNVQRAPQPIKSKKGSSLASKPGKKSGSVSNNKGRGGAWNRTSSGQFTATGGRGSASNPSAAVMKLCGNVMRRLTSHSLNWVFKDPVDVEGLKLTDYYTIIKQPMDFGTIKNKLASGKYQSPEEFCADVRLVFSNCMTYNPPGNQFYSFAQTMSEYFEKLWKDTEKKISKQNLPTLSEKSGFHEEVIDVATKATPAKKRKLSPLQAEVMPESLRPRVTNEEKAKIREALEQEGDLSEKICTFLSENATGDKSEDDEIEIDIDTLSEDAWFTLSQLLDEYFLEKQKLSEKAEPCEIELRNEYGLSSSSMQADKGNEVVDEDIDIGVDEPPVSSYPTVEIERDTDMSNEKETDLGVSIPSDGGVATDIIKSDYGGAALVSHEKESVEDLAEGNQSVSGVDQLEQISQEKQKTAESKSQIDGERIPAEIQVSPEKLYRAALLKNRFADTILKAREKALGPIDKGDPEKLRREMEELELQKKKERARLQAEAKAAEDAKRRVEEAAAAEIKRKRELEREAARQELLKMEKTVEINENSRFFDDLNMLRAGPMEQLSSAAEDESMPDELQEGGFGSFKFEGDNALEQLGLYRKVDDDEEEEHHNALEQLGLHRKVEDEEEEEQHNASEQDMKVDGEEEEGQITSSEQHLKVDDEEEEGQHSASEEHMRVDSEEEEGQITATEQHMKVDDKEEEGQHTASEHMKVDDAEEEGQHTPSEQHMKADDEEEEGQHNEQDMKVDDNGEDEQHNAAEQDMKVDDKEEEGQHNALEQHMKVNDKEEVEQYNALEQNTKVDEEEVEQPNNALEENRKVDDEEQDSALEQNMKVEVVELPNNALEQNLKVDDEEQDGALEQNMKVEEVEQPNNALEQNMKADDEEQDSALEHNMKVDDEEQPDNALEQNMKAGDEDKVEQDNALEQHMKVDVEEQVEQPNNALEHHVKVDDEELVELPKASEQDVKLDIEEEVEQPNNVLEQHVKVDDGEEGEQPNASPQHVKVDDEEEGEQHNNLPTPSPSVKVNDEEEGAQHNNPPTPPPSVKVDGEEEGEQHNNPPTPPPSVNKKEDAEEGKIN